MPFTGYKHVGPGALEVMTKVYDAVIGKLNIPPNDPRTSQIAARIVALVSAGESDVAALSDKVCAELSK